MLNCFFFYRMGIVHSEVFPAGLKNALKGRHFGTLEGIQKDVTDMLKTIAVEDFQRYYALGTMSQSVCSCPRELF